VNGAAMQERRWLGRSSLIAAVAGIAVPLGLDLMLAGFDTDPGTHPILYVLGALFLLSESAALAAGLAAPPSRARKAGLLISALSLLCGALFVLLFLRLR